MKKEEIKKVLIGVLKKNGITKASLFGSLVRGEENENSDIDIIVQFVEGKSLLDLAGLKIELEELFHRKVDVITYKSIHHLLKKHIEKEEEILYA